MDPILDSIPAVGEGRSFCLLKQSYRGVGKCNICSFFQEIHFEDSFDSFDLKKYESPVSPAGSGLALSPLG